MPGLVFEPKVAKSVVAFMAADTPAKVRWHGRRDEGRKQDRREVGGFRSSVREGGGGSTGVRLCMLVQMQVPVCCACVRQSVTDGGNGACVCMVCAWPILWLLCCAAVDGILAVLSAVLVSTGCGCA
jgi:hypothetical protein